MAERLIIGVGASDQATANDAIALAEQAIKGLEVGGTRIAAIATIFGRAEHPAVMALAGYFSLPVHVFDAARLELETPRLANPSDALFARIGCHGVAEAAALAVGGSACRLVVPKTKLRSVTIAVAAAPVS